jgi:ribonuclease T1
MTVFLFGGRPLDKLVLAIFLVLSTGFSIEVHSKELASVLLTQLPAEAQFTAHLIRTGGPFPYAKDASIFGNRERQLLKQPKGYYREYTVKTHELTNRGPRRIVCGGWQAKTPDVCFYTDDHYMSFRRIVQ